MALLAPPQIAMSDKKVPSFRAFKPKSTESEILSSDFFNTALKDKKDELVNRVFGSLTEAIDKGTADQMNEMQKNTEEIKQQHVTLAKLLDRANKGKSSVAEQVQEFLLQHSNKVWQPVYDLIKKEFNLDIKREAIKYNCMAVILQVLHEKAKDDGDVKTFDVLSSAVEFLVKYVKLHDVPEYFFFAPKGMMRLILLLNSKGDDRLYVPGGSLAVRPYVYNLCCTVGKDHYEYLVSLVAPTKAKKDIKFELLPIVCDEELMMTPMATLSQEAQARVYTAFNLNSMVILEVSQQFKEQLGLQRSEFDHTAIVKDGHEMNSAQGSCVQCALASYCCCCFCPGYCALRHCSYARREKIRESSLVEIDCRTEVFRSIILLALGETTSFVDQVKG